MEEFSKIIKNLVREKINIVIFLLVVLLSVNVFEITYFNKNFSKVTKKVDHRYFNLTKTLEEIYNIEIDTHKGKIEKFRG